MAFEKLPLNKAFTLLESGPVIMVTTSDGKKNNIMTISWHMIMDFTPRIAITTGEWNYSFKTLMKTKECVLCVPAVDLIEKTIRIGAVSGSEIDKFSRFELTPMPAGKVKAPLIQECLGCVECKVADYIPEHNIIVLEGVSAWFDFNRKEQRTFHAVGNGKFIVDGEILDYRNLMESKLPDGV